MLTEYDARAYIKQSLTKDSVRTSPWDAHGRLIMTVFMPLRRHGHNTADAEDGHLLNHCKRTIKTIEVYFLLPVIKDIPRRTSIHVWLRQEVVKQRGSHKVLIHDIKHRRRRHQHPTTRKGDLCLSVGLFSSKMPNHNTLDMPGTNPRLGRGEGGELGVYIYKNTYTHTHSIHLLGQKQKAIKTRKCPHTKTNSKFQ